MNRVCQGLTAILALAWSPPPAATEVTPPSTTPRSTSTAVSVHLTGWHARAFAALVLEDPGLAACFLLSPGWWSRAGDAPTLPEPPALGTALAQQTAGVLDTTVSSSQLSVVVAGADTEVPAATACGNSVLVLVPRAGSSTASLAQAIAPVWLDSTLRSAPPDPRCSEPLLALGEALARAGSFSLASLPPALRPVHDWLERKDASPALATLVRGALDPAMPWEARRARLARVGQLDGASPELAHAAAYLVEAFGDVARARRDPLALLLGWRQGGAGYPDVPAALRHALAEPLTAGLAKHATPAERDALAADVLRRTLENGIVPAQPPAGTIPPELRLLAAGLARTQGLPAACRWISADIAPGLRTGCRADGESGGFLYARPRSSGGSDVVARSGKGEEAPLLHWPRWVLAPQVSSERGEIVFLDPQGVWSAPLDAHAAPRLLLPGEFRHLAVAPGGAALATTRWPAGSAVLVGPKGAHEVNVDGRGGITWVEQDVLLASDGEKLTLVALSGETEPWPGTAPCTRDLAARGELILAAVGTPCETGLVRLSPLDGKATPVLVMTHPPAGLTILPDGGVVFGDAEGLWRWSGGERAERVGAGLTPGPG